MVVLLESSSELKGMFTSERKRAVLMLRSSSVWRVPAMRRHNNILVMCLLLINVADAGDVFVVDVGHIT